MGNWNTVLGIGFLMSVYIALTKRYKYFLPLLTTVAGSGLTVYLLKILIGRDRPGMGIAYYVEQSLSFPSGHAALSLALYGYATYVLLQVCGTQKTVWKFLSYAIVSLGVLLIGLSRLYLGVHFLTDILGGYLIGLLWLVIGIVLTEIVWKK
jgi:undecaprenyl-diphosphatase